jgi:hypothetical protein
MFSTSNLPLSSLKKNRHIIDHLLWDFEPKQLMQPRCGRTGEGSESATLSAGYILYIETMEKHPGLFLMVQSASGYAETFAKISDVPDALLAEAIQENRNREYFKMYPINEKLKEWLKKELRITE